MVAKVVETLHQLDTDLYNFLNMSVHTRVMDIVMVFFSSALVWFGTFSLVTAYLCFRRNWKGVRIVGIVLFSVLITDVLCFRILKPTVARYRPCYQQGDRRILMPSCGSPHGFPSNHAANAMAVATIASLVNPLWAPAAVFIAFMVGLSRIYVGVHYPFDVLGGFFVGMLVSGTLWTVLPKKYKET